MRFALLGDHPDGLAMTRALVETGRHELAVYAGPAVGVEYLRRWNLTPARVGDLEEVLADPGITAVIVAGSPANRAALLRRALQSERHVLCVHPPDDRPDTAYEAAMIQADTGFLLVPLLVEPLHPGVQRLATLLVPSGPEPASEAVARAEHLAPATPSVSNARTPGLVELERWSTEEVLLDAGATGHKPGLPGWDVLRFLGGEIVELVGVAAGEEVEGPLLVAGRFSQGGLFQMSLLSRQRHDRWRLTAVSAEGRGELLFPEGWPGPSRLSFLRADGSEQCESFEAWNSWHALAEAFDALASTPRHPRTAITAPARLAPAQFGSQWFPLWQDAVRGVELDDAARRSIERRRASTLEYQEATEEASFKGTMTLVGCSLLWISLVLLILSVWVPALGWVIAPVFAAFLIMQVLRWVVPPPQDKAHPSDAAPPP